MNDQPLFAASFDQYIEIKIQDMASQRGISPDLLVAEWILDRLFSERPKTDSQSHRINGRFAKKTKTDAEPTLEQTPTKKRASAKKKSKRGRSKKPMTSSPPVNSPAS